MVRCCSRSSRSRALSRSRSSVVRPGALVVAALRLADPLPEDVRRTAAFADDRCDRRPLGAVVDRVLVHQPTTRACTWGEYRQDRRTTPTSKGAESPAIPGRL